MASKQNAFSSPFSAGYGSTPAVIPMPSQTGGLSDAESSLLDQVRNQAKTTIALACVVFLSVLISLILGIVVTAQRPESGGLYFCLAFGLLMMSIAELLLIRFSLRNQLPPGSNWCLYAIGLSLLVESILNDVFMYI